MHEEEKINGFYADGKLQREDNLGISSYSMRLIFFIQLKSPNMRNKLVYIQSWFGMLMRIHIAIFKATSVGG